MKHIETKSKSGKSPKELGILTGANFSLKKNNRDARRRDELKFAVKMKRDGLIN